MENVLEKAKKFKSIFAKEKFNKVRGKKRETLKEIVSEYRKICLEKIKKSNKSFKIELVKVAIGLILGILLIVYMKVPAEIWYSNFLFFVYPLGMMYSFTSKLGPINSIFSNDNSERDIEYMMFFYNSERVMYEDMIFFALRWTIYIVFGWALGLYKCVRKLNYLYKLG